MRRGRVFLLLALVILVGLAAVYFLVFKSNLLGGGGTETGLPEPSEATPAPTPIPTVRVVVITQGVVRGEVISAEKLDFQEYPEALFTPLMFTELEQVEGKMARFTMDPYTVMTSALVTDVVDRNQGSDEALFIEPGMVAVSIPVSRLSSISYAPMRGDRVNVIVTLLFVDLDPEFQTILPNWTGNVIAPGGGGIVEDLGSSDPETIITLLAQPYRGATGLGRAYEDPLLEETLYLLPSEEQRPRLVSQTLIQNVVVLQLGNFPTPYEREQAAQPLEPTPTPGPEAQQEQAPVEEEVIPPPPDVVTLIVTPQDAVTLNYLIYCGARLTLVMRNPLDTSVVPTEAVTISYLLDQYNIPIPVKLPYGLQPAVTELTTPVLQNDIIPTPQP
jgi:pilus assembly protein CpaB